MRLVYRASQKLNLNGSPHRRKRRGSQGEDASHGFASGLHKHAPPLPALLQRRIAGKELTGVGKVRSYCSADSESFFHFFFFFTFHRHSWAISSYYYKVLRRNWKFKQNAYISIWTHLGRVLCLIVINP